MNTSPRAWAQRRYEAPRVFASVQLPLGATCLEIGCGRGVGALLISQSFPGCRVVAIDYDPDMIGRARDHLTRPPSWAKGVQTEYITLGVADATALPFPDGSVHAVFAFGILHHIQSWPQAVREVHRVLKPGGVFSCDEFFLDSPLLRANLALAERFDIHPYAMIGERQFKHVLQEAGFVLDSYQRWGGLPVGCFVVARKN